MTILSLGTIHRSWTAPAIENSELGLDLGLESVFVFRRGLLDQGDRRAVLPRVIPVPRFWAMWDLPQEFQASMSFGPGKLYDGVTSFGLGGQWTYFRDSEVDLGSNVVVEYTYANAFGDLKSHTLGVSNQITRNMDTWQPYAGLGLMMSGANVRKDLVATGVEPGTYNRAALHFYFGVRVDLMAKLSFQVDFVNTYVSIGTLMSASF